MEIYLNNGHAFPVPVAVADHLLGLASHDQLKVLLFVLCHADETLTEAQIAKSCKVQPAAVEEALVFWQDCNILQNAPAVPAVSVQKTAAEAPPAETATVQPVQQSRPAAGVQQGLSTACDKPTPIYTSSERFHLLPSEIAERQKDPAIKELFQSAEQYAGRTLNYTEQKSLIWMNEYLGMQPDLISLLIAFCAHIEKSSPSYMEKIARAWQEQNINTPALALEDIEKRTNGTNACTFTNRIRSMFEMPRTPTEYQQGFIDNWFKNGYSLELIRYAYEKTRNSADDKLSFPYIDKILTAWDESGIRTVAEAKQVDESFYAKKRQKKKESGKSSAPASKARKETAGASFELNDFDQLINKF